MTLEIGPTLRSLAYELGYLAFWGYLARLVIGMINAALLRGRMPRP